MARLRNCFYLLVCAGALFCTAPKNSTKDFSKFPASTTQSETMLLNTDLPTPQLMTIYRDSLLLVVNNLNRNPHHVSVYDLNRKQRVNNLMPVGQRKGGTLSFMSFGISGNLVWVFDVAKNGFIAGNLDSLLKSNGDFSHYSERRIKPQVFYYDAVLLNQDEALFSGNYDTDEKLIYVNFRDSTRNRQLLSYRQDSVTGSSRISKMSYESFMLLRPDQQKLILACRYADQFELVDIATGSRKRVSGPVGFAPQLSTFEDNTGTTVATPDNSTQYGFLKGHVTAKFFYLLFSGYPVKGDHLFYGNKIFVYDWEGNPVKQINLKQDIVDFSVSSDDKTLYTLNPRTKAISLSNLN